MGSFGVSGDGRVTVGGVAGLTWGLPDQPPLWRYNPDGSVDPGLAVGQSVGRFGRLYSVDQMVVAPDNSVVFCGDAELAASPVLARLRPDGTLDVGFDSGTGFRARTSYSYVNINALAAVPEGGWLVGGDFAAYDGWNQPYLVKVLLESAQRPHTFQFAVTNVTIWETNGPIALEVWRRGDASSLASVLVRTEPGTALAGQNYVPVDLRLDFAPGEWSKTVTVGILEDRLPQDYLNFQVQLLEPTGGFTVASPATVTVQIRNDDAVVEFVADTFTAVEEDGFARVGLRWSGAVASGMKAVLNLTPLTGSIENVGGVSSIEAPYRPGSTNWAFVRLTDDALPQRQRRFQMVLNGVGKVVAGSRSEALLTIRDSDHASTPGRGIAGIAQALAAAPSGGVYIAGDFTGVHGVPRRNLARLQANGEVDFGFNPGGGPNGYVTTLAVQPDGKLVVAGAFTAVNGLPRAGLARLTPEGDVDPAFDPGLGATSTNKPPFIQCLLPDNDGGLYVSGGFTHFGGRFGWSLVRLLADGRVDESFVSPFRPSTVTIPPQTLVVDSEAVLTMAAVPGGGLIVAGYRTFVPSRPWGMTAHFIRRLTPAGQFNTLFTTLSSTSVRGGLPIQSLALTPDGKLLVGAAGPQSRGWVPITRVDLNGATDPAFQVRNVPALPSTRFQPTGLTQLLQQSDGRILFTVVGYETIDLVTVKQRALVGRLLADGAWDPSFSLVTCDLPLLRQRVPYWFDGLTPDLEVNGSLQPVPTALLAQQTNGVVVLAGTFDSVNGEPRRRLARLEANGMVRGHLGLRLSAGLPPRLLVPDEVEFPYQVEASNDLENWSEWLLNPTPWIGLELPIPLEAEARFFRVRPME
jgi:uncharacterized delta-60 repeat protein